ncbi:MAG: hypothetical protein H6594_02355 [Flavobacteriales bacterium]|nr:hypothetical protein [Flavobacteriales bacterium]
MDARKYHEHLRPCANGNIDSLGRHDQFGALYDTLRYSYHTDTDGNLVRNRLYQVADDDLNNDNTVTEADDGFEDYPNEGALQDEHDQQGNINKLNNYLYDRLGNLVKDRTAEIDTITWTVAGKVDTVRRTSGSALKELVFTYGADGQRVSKTIGDGTDAEREYYIRDAQGNIMAIYRYVPLDGSFTLRERPLYGSKRLGEYDGKVEFIPSPQVPMGQEPEDYFLRYELTDHLGNVNTVVSARLLPGDGAPYEAEVLNAQGYEPFGSLLPGRNYSSDSYRFGFQGQEKDDEVHGATGTSYAFEYRIHDARVGRFMSIDPLAAQYPWNSPYAFAENCVISCIDLEGLERYFSSDGLSLGKLGSSNVMQVVEAKDVGAFSNFQATHGSQSNPPVFEPSKQFHLASADAQSRIAQTIYSTTIRPGKRLSSVKVNPEDGGVGMSVVRGTSQLTIYPQLSNGGEKILNDYYNFVNLLYHEDQHIKGIPGDGWSHFGIAAAQTRHSSFAKMSEQGKAYLKGVMRGYLNEDMEGYMNRMVFMTANQQDANRVIESSEFQALYTQYTEAVATFNKVFDANYQAVDYKKMASTLPAKKD